MLNKTKRLKGYIRWFDSLRGEGMVRLRDGRSLVIHYTSIAGWDKNGWSYPAKKDQRKNLKQLDCIVYVYESGAIRSCELLKTKNNIVNWFEARYSRCGECGQITGLSEIGGANKIELKKRKVE